MKTLTTKKSNPLSFLTLKQRRQVDYQFQSQSHSNVQQVTIDIGGTGHVWRNFKVYPGVFRPDITDSLHFARYLFYNNARLFQNKRVLDLGCGSGILGIVMAKYGAKTATLADINPVAVRNARENAECLGLKKGVSIVESDLFQHVTGRFDVAIFAHPFFVCPETPQDPLARSMLAPATLLSRYLSAVKSKLTKNGVILSSYFDFAGNDNHPEIQGAKHGFSVSEVFRLHDRFGLETGDFLIYELRPR